MKAEYVRPKENDEFYTLENCRILESWNRQDDDAVSIARARLEKGQKTRAHSLRDTVERYLIIEGEAIVHIEGLEEIKAKPGDVFVIPPNVIQWVDNTNGHKDFVFYAICTPRFKPEVYCDR
jgi:mannose-6-phosphate isomerase-like protein (cupin superfamily)